MRGTTPEVAADTKKNYKHKNTDTMCAAKSCNKMQIYRGSNRQLEVNKAV